MPIEQRETGTQGVAVNGLSFRQAFEERERRRRAERERHRQAALRAIRQAVREVLPAYPTVRRAYLFGSVIRPGAFRPDSDIDLAVEGPDMGTCFALWRDLEQALPDWQLDVRPLRKDEHFGRRVKQRGVLI